MTVAATEVGSSTVPPMHGPGLAPGRTDASLQVVAHAAKPGCSLRPCILLLFGSHGYVLLRSFAGKNVGWRQEVEGPVR